MNRIEDLRVEYLNNNDFDMAQTMIDIIYSERTGRLPSWVSIQLSENGLELSMTDIEENVSAPILFCDAFPQ